MNKLVVLLIVLVLVCTATVSFLWLPVVAFLLYMRWIAAAVALYMLTMSRKF